MPEHPQEALVARRNAVVEDAQRTLAQKDHIKLSYWSFERYRECPQKFALHVVEGHGKKFDDSYYAIKGSVVHSLSETFIDGVKDGTLDWSDRDYLIDNIPDRYDKQVQTEYVAWDEHEVNPDEHRTASLPELRNSLDYFYNALKAEGLIPRDPATIHSEYTFGTMIHPKVRITGRSDLVFEDPDGLIVIDPKDVGDRSKVHWRQLIWYALGLEPVFQKPVKKAGFILTHLQDWSWRDPAGIIPATGLSYRDTLFKEILETALKVAREPFPAKVNRHTCGFCPVRDMCPEWQRYSKRSRALEGVIASLPVGRTEF